MSRAFVKEDASGEEVVIPSRASLPSGTPNYVTPRGLALLQSELADLRAERERLLVAQSSDIERARLLAVNLGRIEALEERLSRARLIRPQDQPSDEVGFAATVTVRTSSGENRRLTIVGVDEASALEGRVAFTAPIARVLMGHKVGDEVRLETARGKQILRVVKIEYETTG